MISALSLPYKILRSKSYTFAVIMLPITLTTDMIAATNAEAAFKMLSNNFSLFIQLSFPFPHYVVVSYVVSNATKRIYQHILCIYDIDTDLGIAFVIFYVLFTAVIRHSVLKVGKDRRLCPLSSIVLCKHRHYQDS